MNAHMIWEDVLRIRKEAPLVHNITNYVVMNTTANALLAIGASPVMAHAMDEVEEMTGLARALVLNIGTLSQPWIAAMLKAGREARRKGVPIVLDPVGSGATFFRTTTAHHLLREAPPSILRGNASEIGSLIRVDISTKGVDSAHESEDMLKEARSLSEVYGCAVSVSGPTDLVVSGSAVIRIRNGHPMMSRVTGLGCTASALTGAFAAVNPSPFLAAAHAMAVMGIAGEIAASRASGPGSFQMHFLDALYLISEGDLGERLKVDESDGSFLVGDEL